MKSMVRPGYALRLTALLLLLLYLALAGGTWAVITSFEIRVVSQLILICVLAVWLGRLAANKQRLPATGLDLPVLLGLTATAASTAFSVNQRQSMDALLIVAAYSLLYFVAISAARASPSLLIASLIGCATIVSFASVLELIAWYFGLFPTASYSIAWPSIGLGQLMPPGLIRPHLITGNPNLLAGFVAPVIPLALLALRKSNDRGERAILAAGASTLMLAIVISGSRGGLLAVLAGVISYVGMGWALPRFNIVLMVVRRHLRIVTVGVLAAITAAGWAIYAALTSPHILTGTGGVRLALWRQALAMFQENTLFGYGPDTFGIGLLLHRDPSAPLADLLPHAHNFVLGIAAEHGLLGLIALSVTTLSAAIVWMRAYKQGESERPLLIALAAALVTVAVHGLVEDFRIFPLIVIEWIILLALVAAQDRETHFGSSIIPSARKLVGPFLMLAAMSLYSSFANLQFVEGARMAAGGDPQGGARLVDYAVKLDPLNAFYSFQSGLLHSSLASSSSAEAPTELDAAINSYRTALTFESSYSLNHANLAATLRQQGAIDLAIEEMRRAIDLDPNDLSLRLNLALYLADAGNSAAAKEQALAAVRQDPGVLKTVLWRRLMSAGSWETDIVDRRWTDLEDRPALERAASRGRLALEAGRFQAAEEQFRAAISLAPQSPELWQGLGLSIRQQSRREEATSAFEQAVALAPGDSTAHSDMALALVEVGLPEKAAREAKLGLFLSQGRPSHLAMARAARALGHFPESVVHYGQAVPRPTSFVGYGLTVWHKLGLQFDRAPQLLSIEPKLEDYEIYREYEMFLTSLGRSTDAATVHRLARAYFGGLTGNEESLGAALGTGGL